MQQQLSNLQEEPVPKILEVAYYEALEEFKYNSTAYCHPNSESTSQVSEVKLSNAH